MQNQKKTGVMIVNLGTPDSPTPQAVKKYLAEFLSDQRVISIPSWIWQPILHSIVLPIRSKKSAAAYAKIWRKEGSPLLIFSQRITEGIKIILQSTLQNFHLLLAMRYGSPSIKEVMDEFKKKQIDKLIVLPLYPQYSSAATSSAFDAVIDNLKKWPYLPELSFINQYADNPDYISALAQQIKNFWDCNSRGDKLLFSFHGLPEKSISQGDPYYFLCQQTAKLVAEKLKLGSDQWMLVFQSRFGAQQWLKPYCDKTLKELAKQGCRKLDIVCPGFPADCLETLEEIAIRNKEIFLDAGGLQYHYIPALNDSPEQIEMFVKIVLRNN